MERGPPAPLGPTPANTPPLSRSGGRTMAPRTAGEEVGGKVIMAPSKLEGKLQCDTPSQATLSPSPPESRCPPRRSASARSQSEKRSQSSPSYYTRSNSRGRLRSPSPGLDLWEAQRTLDRGDFIEGVLTLIPGPSITYHPVGLTHSGGHVLLGQGGRPLPWL